MSIDERILNQAEEPRYADPYTRLAWLRRKLEQAERERDEARETASKALDQRLAVERERDAARRNMEIAYADTDDDIAARLAKVPALVEALRTTADAIEGSLDDEGAEVWVTSLRTAIATWEQE